MLDFAYFEKKYRFIAADLSKQNTKTKRDLLTGKGIVRAGSGNKKGKGIVRAGSGNKKGKGIIRAGTGKQWNF